MLRHGIPLLVLCVIFLGSFFFLANTPWLLNRYGAQWLQKQDQLLTVDTFKIADQKFFWPDILVLSGMTTDFRYGGRKYSLAAEQIKLKGTYKSLRQREPVKIQVLGANFKMDNLSLKNVRLDLRVPVIAFKTRRFVGEGMLETGTAVFHRYEADRLRVRFEVKKDEVQIYEGLASLYGGQFRSGQISYKFHPASFYISWSESEGLDGIRLTGLTLVLFEGLTGKVRGTCRLVGTLERIEVLALILEMPEGGTLSPRLLARLAGQLRDSPTKEQLKALSAAGNPLAFTRGTLHIQNVDFRTVALIVEVQNQAMDLHLQERILLPLQKDLREMLLEATP